MKFLALTHETSRLPESLWHMSWELSSGCASHDVKNLWGAIWVKHVGLILYASVDFISLDEWSFATEGCGYCCYAEESEGGEGGGEGCFDLHFIKIGSDFECFIGCLLNFFLVWLVDWFEKLVSDVSVRFGWSIEMWLGRHDWEWWVYIRRDWLLWAVCRFSSPWWGCFHGENALPVMLTRHKFGSWNEIVISFRGPECDSASINSMMKCNGRWSWEIYHSVCDGMKYGVLVEKSDRWSMARFWTALGQSSANVSQIGNQEGVKGLTRDRMGNNASQSRTFPFREDFCLIEWGLSFVNVGSRKWGWVSWISMEYETFL